VQYEVQRGLSSAEKKSRLEALDYDRPCGNFLVKQPRPKLTAGAVDGREDPIASLKRTRHTASQWVGRGPRDPRGSGSVQNLMEIYPQSLSSTTRQTHKYEPLSKVDYEMAAENKLRYSVQHERPDLLYACNLDYLTRREDFWNLERGQSVSQAHVAKSKYYS